MRIKIEVNLTGKRANAEVVYVDPERPLHCGIALAKPANIWGVRGPARSVLRATRGNRLAAPNGQPRTYARKERRENVRSPVLPPAYSFVQELAAPMERLVSRRAAN